MIFLILKAVLKTWTTRTKISGIQGDFSIFQYLCQVLVVSEKSLFKH